MNKLLTAIGILLLLFAFNGCKTEGAIKTEKSPKTAKAKVNHPVTTLNDLEKIFDQEKLPEIVISVTPQEWDKLLGYFDANPRNEKYIRADFTWKREGQILSLGEIAFRLRGNSFSRKRPEGSPGQKHDSDAPDWHHAHFRIDFDRIIDQRFMGLKALNLKWFKDDPSYSREIYCYDLFRRFGVTPALRNSYVRLTIKVKGTEDAYFGIYEMLEPIDAVYLEKRFPGNDKGFLWKCLYPATLESGSARSKMGVEDPDKGKLYAYDLKTRKQDLDKAKEQFIGFMENLKNKEGREFEKWIGQALDVDMFLRTLAVHVLTGMWDDYWNLGNNFYLYFDEKGRATFIPYDYDNSLGTSAWGDYGKADLFAYGHMDGSRPLVEKILEVEKYNQMYRDYLAQLLDEEKHLFNPQDSMERIAQWHELIEKHVDNDTGQDTEIADEPADWGKTPHYRLWDEDPEANFFMVRRNTALRQLGLSGHAFITVRFEVNAVKVRPNQLVLKGQQSPLSFYADLSLLDNGQEGDQKANDQIFTRNVTFTNTYRLMYRLVGMDKDRRIMGPQSNWKMQTFDIDPEQATNVIRLTLE